MKKLTLSPLLAAWTFNSYHSYLWEQTFIDFSKLKDSACTLNKNLFTPFGDNLKDAIYG